MKKIIFTVFLFFPPLVFAQVSYLDEAKQLGSIAGQGMACNASKSRTFDMLSHAIILSKASNETVRDSALKAFIEEKVRAYQLTKTECPEVLRTFDNQQIFQIKLYQDGTLQMPDGAIITPKIPYDASQI